MSKAEVSIEPDGVLVVKHHHEEPLCQNGKGTSNAFLNIVLVIVALRVVVFPLAALAMALAYILIDYFALH